MTRLREKYCYSTDACRREWGELRETHSGALMSIKCLTLHPRKFGVYADSAFVCSVSACCAWDAKIKAVKLAGWNPFISDKEKVKILGRLGD